MGAYLAEFLPQKGGILVYGNILGKTSFKKFLGKGKKGLGGR